MKNRVTCKPSVERLECRRMLATLSQVEVPIHGPVELEGRVYDFVSETIAQVQNEFPVFPARAEVSTAESLRDSRGQPEQSSRLTVDLLADVVEESNLPKRPNETNSFLNPDPALNPDPGQGTLTFAFSLNSDNSLRMSADLTLRLLPILNESESQFDSATAGELLSHAGRIEPLVNLKYIEQPESRKDNSELKDSLELAEDSANVLEPAYLASETRKLARDSGQPGSGQPGSGQPDFGQFESPQSKSNYRLVPHAGNRDAHIVDMVYALDIDDSLFSVVQFSLQHPKNSSAKGSFTSHGDLVERHLLARHSRHLEMDNTDQQLVFIQLPSEAVLDAQAINHLERVAAGYSNSQLVLLVFGTGEGEHRDVGELPADESSFGEHATPAEIGIGILVGSLGLIGLRIRSRSDSES